jgi:RND family efflux transporter MFP subunit
MIAAKPDTIAKPIALPANTTFVAYISGAGIIEANTENIAIGTEIPGIVSKIDVKVGSVVKKGDMLFAIDERDAKAQLALAEADLKEVQSTLADVRDQLRMVESVKDKRAMSLDELNRKHFLVAEGTTKVGTAKARIFAAQTNIDGLHVVAPVDGEVMKLNIRIGEYAPSGALSHPLIKFGNLDPMHIRIDIDENDAWRFKTGAKGTASLCGNRNIHTPINFVNIEPYATPKQSLTGDSTERVGTRVLQVIYAYDRANMNAYAG